MSACDECLRASLMRSEAMTLMEERGLSIARAGEALESPLADVLHELGADRTPALQRFDGIWTLCRHSAEFPDALTRFRRDCDVPLALFGVGRRELLEQAAERRTLAIVGARRASAYGREIAYSLAADGCARGLTVVSGMALGIDGAAHRGALQAGGPTIAVLAGGPDRPYPRSHRLLYEQILQNGCAISENPPGTEGRRWAFVARNRIIAGISAMTVWVEGTEASGARHTVAFADELDLPMGVVPGPVSSAMSAGPNSRLGVAGILPIRGIDDVLDELKIERLPLLSRSKDATVDESAGEVLGLMATGVRTPRELAQAMSARTPREISQILGRLELAGVVARDPSGEYRRL